MVFFICINKYIYEIFYTGIGCNTKGQHTEQEFLDIMNKEFAHKKWSIELEIIPIKNHYQLQYNNWFLPDDFIFFSLIYWIEYSGAEICK